MLLCQANPAAADGDDFKSTQRKWMCRFGGALTEHYNDT